jgi:putative IMPACT (imprinted ancient) family translation regulator
MNNAILYKTIEKTAEGLYKEKGSKFLSFAFPVTTEEQIKNIQQELRKEYYDARHHVFAWKLGIDENNYRASDDGEPANSSGPPVLGQIRSYELSDILIVVIRYFGGTKLGIPGLINAYKTATKDAIDNNLIIDLEDGAGYYESMHVKVSNMEELGEVAEGIGTTYALHEISQDKDLYLPIAKEVYKMLEGKNPKESLRDLLSN